MFICLLNCSFYSYVSDSVASFAFLFSYFYVTTTKRVARKLLPENFMLPLCTVPAMRCKCISSCDCDCDCICNCVSCISVSVTGQGESFSAFCILIVVRSCCCLFPCFSVVFPRCLFGVFNYFIKCGN